ncbi:MAG: hypothetical protein QNJ32_06110 [Xenococcaceae cyanobacterium MO_167.B27]|nr:hypothetical protein [Xenococcaceae cyanobacterium MO_167.B27]
MKTKNKPNTKVIVEADIILDFVNTREPFKAESKALLELLNRHEIEGYITESIVREVLQKAREFHKENYIYMEDPAKFNEFLEGIELAIKETFQECLKTSIPNCIREKRINTVITRNPDWIERFPELRAQEVRVLPARRFLNDYSLKKLTKILYLFSLSALALIILLTFYFWNSLKAKRAEERAYKTCSNLPENNREISNYWKLGLSCLAIGKHQEKDRELILKRGLDAFQRVNNNDKNNPQTIFYEGLTQELLKDYEEADRLYKKTIALYRDRDLGEKDVEILVEIGNYLVTQGQDEAALIIYQKVLEQFPQNSPALLGVGTAYFKLNKNLEEAFNAYDIALKNLKSRDAEAGEYQQQLKENLAEAYYNIGALLVKKGDYSRAIESFGSGISYSETKMKYYLERGKFFALILDEQYREAIHFLDYFADSEKIKQEQELFLFGLGIANFALEKYHKAALSFREAKNYPHASEYLKKAKDCSHSPQSCKNWKLKNDTSLEQELQEIFPPFIIHYYQTNSLLQIDHHKYHLKHDRNPIFDRIITE